MIGWYRGHAHGRYLVLMGEPATTRPKWGADQCRGKSMYRQGERFRDQFGTAQRRRQQGCTVDAIMLGTLIGVVVLTIEPFQSLLSLHAAPQLLLAYGGATYAVAMVAALLSGLVSKLRLALLRLVVISVVGYLIIFPPLMGSVCIAVALNYLASWHTSVYGVVFVGILLYAVLSVVVWRAVRRRPAAPV
jgi:hypothetical protein